MEQERVTSEVEKIKAYRQKMITQIESESKAEIQKIKADYTLARKQLVANAELNYQN